MQKLSVEEIIRLYKGLNLSQERFDLLEEFYFKKEFSKLIDTMIENKFQISNFTCDSPDSGDEDFTQKMKQRNKIRKQIIKELMRSYPKYNIDSEFIKKYNQIFLNESIACLNNAVYWFLMYRNHMDIYSIKSGIQAKYYSEFFTILAIGTFLGISITFIQPIRKGFEIQRVKNDNGDLQVDVKLIESNSHEIRYNQIYEYIKNVIDLSNEPELAEKFTNKSVKSWMKEDRENYVYNISERENYPWNFSYWDDPEGRDKYKEGYCFLDGIDKVIEDSTAEDEGFYDFVESIYGDWGYEEHYLGSLMKWLINKYKEIGLTEYIHQIYNILYNFMGNDKPKTVESALKIVSQWFNDGE